MGKCYYIKWKEKIIKQSIWAKFSFKNMYIYTKKNRCAPKTCVILLTSVTQEIQFKKRKEPVSQILR